MEIEKVIKKIKGCAFGTDRDENLSSSKNLLEIRTKLQERQFVLKQEQDKAKNEVLIKDEIQKGKNAEVRNAMVELELAGSKFDKVKEYGFLLGIIIGVERHNQNVLDMFFNGDK